MLSYKNFARKFLYDKLLITFFSFWGTCIPPQNEKTAVNDLSYKNFPVKFLYDTIFQKFLRYTMAFIYLVSKGLQENCGFQKVINSSVCLASDVFQSTDLKKAWTWTKPGIVSRKRFKKKKILVKRFRTKSRS